MKSNRISLRPWHISDAPALYKYASDTVGYGPSCECNLPAREEEPTVGYWVGRPYWGMGICTEALRMMIEHIRKTTTIRSLISGHFIDNPASLPCFI
ncbi:MAG: GNAT family N-acetyltransferase [Prevotellaceae bacterium]|nr:GNAT family N-acetyltransferase [Prevotellaceae bacterium]MDD6842345.1 GNAT family N-acetyltransferase [Prevotellaceae bacterium]MDD6977734.1 GNAT family N-acetyltransferase [Prevotellaceae bacterium]MDY6200594.1 GNAT family N-acetyltransferase [Prevotella sp.]